MRLRASGLLEEESWVPSISVCVHAAEGVLTTYLQLHRCVLSALLTHNEPNTDECLEPAAYKLPTTWRQVKRIMMSTFVIIIAYWHGEMAHGEASRYIAMARLLLEYPRWRWAAKLDSPIQTLCDVSRLGEFNLEEHMRLLLPGLDESLLRPPAAKYVDAVEKSDAAPKGPPPTSLEPFGSAGDETYRLQNEPFFASGFMSGMLDYGIMDDSRDPSMYSLFETMEYPVEIGSWAVGT